MYRNFCISIQAVPFLDIFGSSAVKICLLLVIIVILSCSSPILHRALTDDLQNNNPGIRGIVT